MNKPISYMATRFLILCIGLFLIFNGCRTNKTKTNEKADSIGHLEVPQIDSFKNMVYLLLSPNEILSEIFTQKLTLNAELLNPRNNAGKYLDVKHQALNLGVYIGDFAYLNMCGNKSFALDYFKIIRDLAQKNNIYGCFDEAVFNRIQNNLANSDSLIAISQEMYYNMSDILENANRQNIYALIASGALIESLYISVMNAENPADNEQIAQRVFEQKQLFDSFYAFVSLFKNESDLKSVIMQLDTIKNIYAKVTINTSKKVVSKDKQDHIQVKGGLDIVGSKTIFNELKEDIMMIRHDITSISTK